MNEIIEKENILVEEMIYEIRGVQVMLSSDVAKLYQVETKRINEVIKRNITRFPESFCFQLTSDEIDKNYLQGRNLRPWTKVEIFEDIILNIYHMF